MSYKANDSNGGRARRGRRLWYDGTGPVALDGLIEALGRVVAGPDDGRVASFIEWAERLPTASGEPLDWGFWPFQPEMYRVFGDLEREEVVVMKSTQVGVSELCLRFTLFLADVHALRVLYVFPSWRQMGDFSAARLGPLIEQSSDLQARTGVAPGWPNSKGMRRIGTAERSGYIYCRGSESREDLLSLPADLVVLDEYDSLVAKHIPEAERRIGASNLGLIRRVGVPSDPEFGIAKQYRDSDARVWVVKCPHCNFHQSIGFLRDDEHTQAYVTWDERDGRVESPRVVCARCEKRVDVQKGEWVAQHPDRSRPGFHVHRLMVAGERHLRNVIENSNKHSSFEVKAFWCNDMGLPHSDAEDGLDRAVISASIAAAESVYGKPWFQGGMRGLTDVGGMVTMGVDVAGVRNLNVRISLHFEGLGQGARKIGVFVGEVDSFDKLVDLMRRYRVNLCVIDHLPETRLALSLASQFPGRVLLCNFSATQADPIVLKPEDQRVSVNRTVAMDTTVSIFRQMRNLLPEDLPEGYIEQMVAPRRETARDEYDKTTVGWVAKGPFDYFMAETYDLVATETLKIMVAMQEQAQSAGDIVFLSEQMNRPKTSLEDPDRPYRDLHYPGQTQPEDLMFG